MKIRFMLGLAIVLCGPTSTAQDDGPFALLNLEEVTSGLFRPQAPGWGDLPDGTGYGALSFSSARQTFFEVEKSRLDPTLFPQLETIWDACREIKIAQNAVPIVLLEVKYHDFRENAIEEGLLGLENGQYVDLTSEEESPFEERMTTACIVDREYYTQTHQTFIFPSDLYITNVEDDLPVIEVDFDDGVGWRSVLWDQPVDVYYNTMDTDRNIRVNVNHTGGSRHCGFQLRSGGGGGDYSQLDLPPWPTNNSEYPWRFGAEYGDMVISGNAYTSISADGIFDKPFIFVEGIDFGNDFSSNRYGTFGWYEFASGQSAVYNYLALMPVLLEDLHAQGYDVILLDFEHGADYIQRNAALLKELINRVNEYKVGDAPNVVVGASMGGQVSRYALRTMELDGQDHCCRLWVSIDSPHKGAYIPAAIQEFIYILNQYTSEARWFIDNALMSPAARQMLRYQTFGGSDLYNDWYATLNEIGYPEDTRNIAISNGSLSGWSPGIESGDVLLEYDWSFMDNQIVAFDLLALDGDPSDPASSNGSNVITRVRLPKPGQCFSPACLAQELFNLVPEQVARKVNTNTIPNFALAPGGMANTMDKLVSAINGFLNRYSFLPNIPANGYVHLHSFITVNSAFGMSDQYMFSNIGLAVELDPSITPFDMIYAPQFANQRHTEVTLENIGVLRNAVLNGEHALDSELTSNDLNGGVFNYCLAELNTIGDVVIHDGGKVHVNAYLPSHFAQPTDELPATSSTFKLRTALCGTSIRIESGGALLLGDETVGNSGELEIRSGSEVIVDAGGVLILEESSRIIIKDGGILKLTGGNCRLYMNSQIVIEEGGKLIIDSNAPVYLNGAETRIDVSGNIEIADNTTFSIAHLNFTSGKLIMHTTGHRIVGGSSAKMNIEGDGPDDKVIEVLPGAEFKMQNGMGSLLVSNGMVYIREGGIFHSRNHGNFDHVKFIGESNSSIRVWKSNEFRDCLIENIKVEAPLVSGILEMENCTFTGANGQLVVQGQGYKIRDSLFEDCKGISSSGLTLSSSISRTYFDMGGSGENAVAVRDNSNAGLTLEECTIIRSHTGVMKDAGSLFLKCNDIRQNAWTGVIVGNGCRAYLDEPHESGHNVIVQNTNNILLDHAGALEVYHGGNFIHTAEEWNISGSLSGTCNNCSDVLINGEHNHWSSSMYLPLDAIPGEPNAADFNISIVDPNCPAGNPPSGCEATIVDPDPVLQYSCSSAGSSGAKKSLTSSAQVEVWPNPASDQVHLSFGAHPGSGVWKLVDSSGRTVISGSLPALETTLDIDISQLATGYYFLAMQWENEDYRIPVVVGK